MTQSYTINIGAASSGDANYVASIQDYSNISITKNPTGFGSWEATIPYSQSIEDNILERIFVVDETVSSDEDSVVFAGILEQVSSDGTGSGETKISGRGIFLEEDYESRTYSVSNSFLSDEIQNYASNYIGFDTTFKTATTTSDSPFTEDGGALIDNLTNPTGATSPLVQDSDRVGVSNVGIVTDFNQSDYDNATKTGSVSAIDDGSYSQSSGVRLGGASGTHTFSSTTFGESFEYDVDDWEIPLRFETNNQSGISEVRIFINGTKIATGTSFPTTRAWVNPLSNANWTVNNTPTTISNNTSVSYTFEVDTTDSTATVSLDAFSLHDSRYSYQLPSSLNSNGVYSGPEQVPQQFTYQFEAVGSQVDTKASAFFQIEGRPYPSWPFNTISADFTGSLQSGGTDTVSRTYTSPDNIEYVSFDAEFSSEATSVQVDLIASTDNLDSEVSNETGDAALPAVKYAAIVPFSSENLTFIQNKEYTGTDASIYKQLHDDSVYDFSVDYADYNNIEINTFPEGDLSVFEGVRTKDYTRQVDYGDYANKVTVIGRRSDGTRLEATQEDSDEISRLGKTVHRTFTMPDKKTQVEVDYAAKNKLQQLIRNKNQSGSIEAVPSRIQAGKAYGFTPFNDKFTNGGTIGEAGVVLDSQSDWIQADTYSHRDGETSIVFQFLIWPQLDGIADDEYRTVFGTTRGNGGDFVRIYGDGSIGACQPTDGGGTSFSKTPPLIENESVERVTIHMNTTSGEGGIYIGGGASGSPDASLNHTAEPDLGHLVVGANAPNSVGATTTQPDVWYRIDAPDTTSSNVLMSGGDDLSDGITVLDMKNNHDATVSNAGDYVSWDGSTVSGGGIEFTVSGYMSPSSGETTTFEIGTGDISTAMWIDGVNTSSHLFDKMSQVSGEGGHELFVDTNGFLNYRVSDGSSSQLITGSTNVSGGEHHVAVTLDNDGDVRLWIDGEVDVSEAYQFTGVDISFGSELYFGNDSGGNRPIGGTLSDVAWWGSAAVPFIEMEALGTFNRTSDTFVGGLDDVRVWDAETGLQTMLDYPLTSTESSVYDSFRDNLYVLWAFDMPSYVEGYDFIDSGGFGLPPTNLYNYGGSLYSPSRGSVKEVSISLDRGSANMSIKLNLSRRVDVKLNETEKSIEQIKKEL